MFINKSLSESPYLVDFVGKLVELVGVVLGGEAALERDFVDVF